VLRRVRCLYHPVSLSLSDSSRPSWPPPTHYLLSPLLTSVPLFVLALLMNTRALFNLSDSFLSVLCCSFVLLFFLGWVLHVLFSSSLLLVLLSPEVTAVTARLVTLRPVPFAAVLVVIPTLLSQRELYADHGLVQGVSPLLL
jgi:hypothetical protein